MAMKRVVSGNRKTAKRSAGLLLYRVNACALEVLLAHPGGPYWRNKDEGSWSIPKGEIEPGEEELAAARREFAEETGFHPDAPALDLGSTRQPGGKIVHVWAVASDWNCDALVSNVFQMEWPPRSGKLQSFPEIDRAAWFAMPRARTKILKGQVIFLDRLEQMLAR
jgi:predicted NUDIX family NTP pyrophosphohydrolase